MRNWQFYVNRKFNYFVEWVQTVCTNRKIQKEVFGFAFPLKNYLILNGNEYFLLEEAKEFEKFLDRKLKEDRNFFKKFAKSEFRVAERARKIENWLKRKKDSLSRLHNKELLKIFEIFLKNYINIFATAFVRPDSYLEKKVKEDILKFFKKDEEKTEEVFKIVATYPNKNLNKLDYLEEPLGLLKITTKIQERKLSLKNLPEDIKEKIENHCQKYEWLKNPNDFQLLSLSKSEILNRIRYNLKENAKEKVKHILKTRKENERNYRKIIQELKFPQRLKTLIEALRTFIYLRTFTTEAADRLFYWARKTILKEIAKRMKVKDEDVVSLTGEEIIDFLKSRKKISKKIMKERRKIFAVIWKNGIPKIYYGKKAREIIEKYKELRVPSISEKKEILITGQVANRGKVRGRVKILSSHLEVGKVKSGEILVVTMTTPDFISAMEKAVAFVTDEGGITCHAAIVAREMNKPCIIGTKIATKVLKDGDLIEVDADKGVVRLLEHSKERY